MLTARLCGWCLNPYIGDRRALALVEALRRTVKVEMTVPFDPDICDACINSVLGSANPEPRVTGELAPLTHFGNQNLLLKQ